MSAKTPEKKITSDLRPGKDFSNNLTALKQRKAGKDASSIAKIKKNAAAMDDDDFNTSVRFITYYWKSLPANPDNVDAIIAEDKKAAKKNKSEDKAPIKQLEAFAESFKTVMSAVTKGVEPSFKNWSIIGRAYEDALKPLAEEIIELGNTGDKKMVQKAFFVAFIDEESDVAAWLSTMISCYGIILDHAFGKNEMNITQKVTPVFSAEEWITFFNGKTIKASKRPPLANAQEAFQIWKGELLNETPNEQAKPTVEQALEIAAIVQPARLLAVKSQLINNSAEITEEWSTQLNELYTELYNMVAKRFKLQPVNQIIDSNKAFNEAFRETVSTVKNFTAQYRIKKFGGVKRLGANEARNIVKFKLNLGSA